MRTCARRAMFGWVSKDYLYFFPFPAQAGFFPGEQVGLHRGSAQLLCREGCSPSFLPSPFGAETGNAGRREEEKDDCFPVPHRHRRELGLSHPCPGGSITPASSSSPTTQPGSFTPAPTPAPRHSTGVPLLPTPRMGWGQPSWLLARGTNLHVTPSSDNKECKL